MSLGTFQHLFFHCFSQRVPQNLCLLQRLLSHHREGGLWNREKNLVWRWFCTAPAHSGSASGAGELLLCSPGSCGCGGHRPGLALHRHDTAAQSGGIDSPAANTGYFYSSELSCNFSVLQIPVGTERLALLCVNAKLFFIYTCVYVHTLSIYIDVTWAFRYLKKIRTRLHKLFFLHKIQPGFISTSVVRSDRYISANTKYF